MSAIEQSLWYEYVQPILDGNTDETTSEGNSFWKRVQDLMPKVAEECKEFHKNKKECAELLMKSKETLLTHIIQFSTEEMELHFIRPLAIARGLLPTVFDFSKGADLSYIESLRALDFDGNELLASAIDEMGFVKGSVPKAKCPTDSLPTCKYMALFNADPSFDGLRYTFFDGTEDICIANLSILKNIIETCEVPLSLLQHASNFTGLWMHIIRLRVHLANHQILLLVFGLHTWRV